MPAIRGLGFLGRTRERERLDAMLAQARAGQSAVLVIRGEPGIGKTALLRYAARQASGLRIAEVEGVQAEMELAVRGDPSAVRAAPRRARRRSQNRSRTRSRVALGVSSGDAPDRFLVAVAVLNLLCRDRRRAPAPVPGGRRAVARRRVGAGARIRRAAPAGGTGGDDLRAARADHHAARSTACRSCRSTASMSRMRALCCREPYRAGSTTASATGSSPRPRGNPLALVELSQSMSPAERAGGFAPPAAGDLPSQLEEQYLRRVAELPEATQRLILLAAAEPLGDATLLWRAAERLSTDAGALASRGGSRAAGDRRPRSLPPPAGALGGLPSRVTRRTTARARRAGGGERSRARRRPPRLAPRTRRRRTRRSRRRRARALGRASARPRRARGRSGAPRAGDRADPRRDAPGRARAGRGGGELPGRARSTRRARCWPRRRPGRSTASRAREPRSFGATVAFVSAYGNEAAPLLLEAARRLEPFDLSLARRAYLTAWSAATTAQHFGGADVLLEICRAVRALPPLSPDPHPLDLVLEGFALLITDGHAVAMPILAARGEGRRATTGRGRPAVGSRRPVA